ncbi:MAG: hypothetical protein DMG22_03920, partial [Acidobacteria bacterium]
MRKVCVTVLLGCTLVLSSNMGFGQGNLGAVTGTVRDPAEALLPGAVLTLTNTETGVKATLKSSSAGYYRVPVPPGTYRLEVDKLGFKTAVVDKIEVPVAQVVTVDVTMQVGTQTQTVEVTGQLPLLTTSTAEVGSAVSPEEFETLPIEVGDGGRNPQTFIFTSLPGTQGDTFSGSINGGQLFSHEILIDGLSIGRYDLSGGSMDEYSPGTDAIGEFKVQMTNYSAEYGETGGGIANFSLKSGSNQFHGSLFDYNKNPKFNAAGLIVNAFPDLAKDNEKENNFGGTLGGPVRKDHTFFFFSYEGDRFRSFAYSGAVTIPTKAMDGGDFSEILGAQVSTCGSTGDQPCVDALGRPILKNAIYDPTSTRTVTGGQVDPVTNLMANFDATIRDPFPGNQIPQSEFSKATSTLLPLFPAPLFGGTSRNTPEFSGCCPILNRDAYNVKVDQVIGTNQHLTAMFGYYKRFRWHRTRETFPPFPGQPINPTKNQIVGGPQARVSHSWTVNDHSVNEFSAGYNRFNNANNISND